MKTETERQNLKKYYKHTKKCKKCGLLYGIDSPSSEEIYKDTCPICTPDVKSGRYQMARRAYERNKRIRKANKLD